LRKFVFLCKLLKSKGFGCGLVRRRMLVDWRGWGDDDWPRWKFWREFFLFSGVNTFWR
jgi:hypothetical protein